MDGLTGAERTESSGCCKCRRVRESVRPWRCGEEMQGVGEITVAQVSRNHRRPGDGIPALRRIEAPSSLGEVAVCDKPADQCRGGYCCLLRHFLKRLEGVGCSTESHASNDQSRPGDGVLEYDVVKRSPNSDGIAGGSVSTDKSGTDYSVRVMAGAENGDVELRDGSGRRGGDHGGESGTGEAEIEAEHVDKAVEDFEILAGEAVNGEDGVPGHDVAVRHLVEQVLGDADMSMAGACGDEEVPGDGVPMVGIGEEDGNGVGEVVVAEVGGDDCIEVCGVGDGAHGW